MMTNEQRISEKLHYGSVGITVAKNGKWIADKEFTNLGDALSFIAQYDEWVYDIYI